MDGESLDIKHDRLQRLKEFFPELFAENQLDWEKLKAAFDDDINFANERYVLNWAGKSDAFRVLQQPTTATLKPIPEESVLTAPLSSPCKGGELSGYYSINNNELIIALDVMTKKIVEQIITAKPQKVITLDSLFTGNDQLKTNTVLQMLDAGIDFKTI